MSNNLLMDISRQNVGNGNMRALLLNHSISFKFVRVPTFSSKKRLGRAAISQRVCSAETSYIF